MNGVASLACACASLVATCCFDAQHTPLQCLTVEEHSQRCVSIAVACALAYLQPGDVGPLCRLGRCKRALALHGEWSVTV